MVTLGLLGSAGAAPAWWSATKPRLLLAIGALLLLGILTSCALPSLGSWGALPAALLGLGYFGRQAA